MCCSAAAAVPPHQAQLSLVIARRQICGPSNSLLMLIVIVCELATAISAMRMRRYLTVRNRYWRRSQLHLSLNLARLLLLQPFSLDHFPICSGPDFGPVDGKRPVWQTQCWCCSSYWLWLVDVVWFVRLGHQPKFHWNS